MLRVRLLHDSSEQTVRGAARGCTLGVLNMLGMLQALHLRLHHATGLVTNHNTALYLVGTLASMFPGQLADGTVDVLT